MEAIWAREVRVWLLKEEEWVLLGPSSYVVAQAAGSGPWQSPLGGQGRKETYEVLLGKSEAVSLGDLPDIQEGQRRTAACSHAQRSVTVTGTG